MQDQVVLWSTVGLSFPSSLSRPCCCPEGGSVALVCDYADKAWSLRNTFRHTRLF